MIALHAGHKANIKAMQDLKGDGRKKMGAEMAPTWPPVAPLVMAGKLEQSKLDGHNEPLLGLVSRF